MTPDLKSFNLALERYVEDATKIVDFLGYLAGANPDGTFVKSTAEQAELLKHEPNHLLQPAIRIKAETDIPIPGVADRRRDPQLATTRLRSCRLVHSRSDDPQLELADAPLHAEQQAVVR